eukprot:1191148-Prorocentrum_minimum.AAC.4
MFADTTCSCGALVDALFNIRVANSPVVKGLVKGLTSAWSPNSRIPDGHGGISRRCTFRENPDFPVVKGLVKGVTSAGSPKQAYPMGMAA